MASSAIIRMGIIAAGIDFDIHASYNFIGASHHTCQMIDSTGTYFKNSPEDISFKHFIDSLDLCY